MVAPNKGFQDGQKKLADRFASSIARFFSRLKRRVVLLPRTEVVDAHKLRGTFKMAIEKKTYRSGPFNIKFTI